MAEPEPITLLLQEFAEGDRAALDRLIPFVYSELRRLAESYLRRERASHTLQPTALVHEAYARMVGSNQPSYQNRAHFLAVAARVMRQILIDYARSHKTAKRGGDSPKFSLDEASNAAVERPFMMVALADAMDALTRHDPRKAQLIEMRFFGGLTAEESAAVLDLPVQTVRYELKVAQAWLHRALSGPGDAAIA